MASLAAFTLPTRAPGTERPVVLEFLVGYAALWLVLTAMTETPKTSGLAAAFAASIATGATVLYLASAVENVGLVPPGSAGA